MHGRVMCRLLATALLGRQDQVIARGARGRASRLAGLGAGALALVTLVGGCDVGSAFDGFGWPEKGITPQANRMYDLWIGSVIAALAVGALGWGLVFW